MQNSLFSSKATATAVAVVNALVSAGALRADPAAAPADSANNPNSAEALPTVIVSGQQESRTLPLPKLSQPLIDTPQSVDIVSQQTMNEQGDTTLRDALRNVAGISLAAGEGSSQGDNLTLRGFTARNDLFLDGMRDFGSYYRDPFDLREIDVLEGPSSVIFGRGSTGGVINQESKTPQVGAFASGDLTIGTDSTRRVTADVNEPLPDFAPGAAFRFNLMGDEGGVADRNDAENRRMGVAPSLALGMGTATQLTFSFYHQSEDDVPDYGLPWYFNRPAPVARDNFYGFTDDYLRADVNVGTIEVDHEVNGNFTLIDQLRYANYGRDFRISEPQILAGTATLTTPLSAITINRNEISGSSVESLFDDQADATVKFATGEVAHTLVFGVEAARETSDPTRYAFTGVPGTNLVAPNENQAFSGTASVSTKVDTTAATLAGYAIDTVELGRNWELMGGFRIDRFDADYAQFVAPSAAFVQIEDMPSWRGAIVYKPLANGSIYIDAGNSFDPSAETLSLSAANANTPPEKNLTFEAGTKWDFASHKLSLRSSVFRTEKTNAREPDPTDPVLNVLGGNQRVDGVELDGTGHLTDRWDLRAAYALMDSEVVSSVYYPAAVGAPLANAPKNTFAAWTTYRLPGGLEFGGGGNYVGPRDASATVPDDPTTGLLKQVPGYWVFNAMIEYPISKHLVAQVNLDNLENRTFYDEPHPGHVVMGPGRSAQFSLKFKY